MSPGASAAVSVILLAQVFFLGLTTVYLQTEIVARFRERLDDLRDDALELDVVDYDPSTGQEVDGFDARKAARLRRQSETLGIDLVPVYRRWSCQNLWPQLVFASGAAVLLVLILIGQAGRDNLSLVGNPFSDSHYAVGYSIAASELLLIAVVLAQNAISKAQIRARVDVVIAAFGSADEARYVVTPGLARNQQRDNDFEKLDELPRPRIAPRFAAGSDPRRALCYAKYVAGATCRAYTDNSALSRRNRVSYALRLAEAGQAASALVESAFVEGAREELQRTVDGLEVLVDYANILHYAAKYDDCLRIACDAESRLRNLVGVGVETCRAMRAHAAELFRRGDYISAGALVEEEIAALVRMLGPAHSATLGAESNKAVLLARLGGAGNVDQAMRLNAEIFMVRDDVLGPEHPDTLNSLASLSSGRIQLGDLATASSDKAQHFSAALKLGEELLLVRRRVLGAEHPDTLDAMFQVGVAISRMGDVAQSRTEKASRYGAALALDEEVLLLRRRVLGAEHPDTLASKLGIAFDFVDIGDVAQASDEMAVRFTEALKLGEEVAQLRLRVLGVEHPDTLDATSVVALVLRRLSDIAPAPAEKAALRSRASKLEEDVADVRTRVSSSP